jgi:predicted MFS family arabinose efflux permease
MQMSTDQGQGSREVPAGANWMAVIALALGVASLIIAEFLPAGMLTPMAEGLGISEGMTGQAVTATSILAVATSLLISVVTAAFDRRAVLMSLSGILVVLSAGVFTLSSASWTLSALIVLALMRTGAENETADST